MSDNIHTIFTLLSKDVQTFYQPNWRGFCKHETKSNFLAIIMGISIYSSVDIKIHESALAWFTFLSAGKLLLISQKPSKTP